MSTNALYFMVGALLAGAGLGMCQDNQRSGVEISAGRNGVSIQERQRARRYALSGSSPVRITCGQAALKPTSSARFAAASQS